MKTLKLAILSSLILLGITLAYAQSSNQLKLNYDWMKDKPASANQKEPNKPDFVFENQQLNPFLNQNHLSPPNGKVKNNRYTLLMVVPETDKLVEMPTMKIDTSMHYHLRWKNKLGGG